MVLIDGNSIAYRAFYALPLLSNTQGLYTNAVYGFAMMLSKVLDDEKPSHVLVAFDAGKTTFRHETYAEYKGTRQKTPGELAEQIPLIKNLLDAYQIRYLEMENYEADDIIGSFAQQVDKEKYETLIVSGDKDLLQLVSEHVQVLLPKRGVTETVRYDVKAVEEKYGIKPQQIIDLKGLMGDTSDNIPGIPGVGEKTALKLLKQFGTVEEVVNRIDEISGKKLQEKVRQNRQQALLSKQLATIYTEIPLPLSIEDLRWTGGDHEQIVALFKKLEFKSLLERMDKSQNLKNISNQIEQETISVQEIYTSDELKDWESFFQQDPLSVFVEITEDNPHYADIAGISVSDGQKQLFLTKEVLSQSELIQQWLSNSERKKYLFAMKKTRLVLRKLGYWLNGCDFDTLLAAYLLNPSESQMKLSDVVHRYLDGGLPSDDEVYGKGAKRKLPTGEILATHLARKAKAIHQLVPVLERELKEANLYSLMMEMEMPLADILAEMEWTGIRVDQDRLNELGIELKESMDQLQEEIYQIAGVEFNINSPKQLGEILFEKLGLPVLKKTKTGYSTSADVLEKLALQHEIVEKILHYRQVGKLYSTYIEGLKKEIGSDGKIHTRFHQTVTATGRLSSSEPNLQNIPIRLEEGRRIRQVFIPSKDGWLILGADYSQIELRVLAHISGDENLRKAFCEGKDIHTQTAMDIFGVKEDEVTPLMRRQAKAVNFGIVYGISGYGLSQGLDIPQKEAKQFIDRYFEMYPKVKEYMDQVIQEAKEQGYVTTLLGRRRYLPQIHSRNYGERSFAERTAMNTPIQGTAADIIKYAMIQVDRKMKEQKLESRMLLQVHDELIFEVPKDEVEIMQKLVRETMEQAIPLSVPLTVDVNVGSNWYEVK